MSKMVLALVSDLMMQSQLSAAALRAGVEFKVCGTESALLQAAAESAPARVIVDLSHPGLDATVLLRRLAELLPEEIPTLAFGPHVHKSQLEVAAAAGFSTVMSRGQFHANLDRYFAEVAGGA